jgi:hypothetical protein
VIRAFCFGGVGWTQTNGFRTKQGLAFLGVSCAAVALRTGCWTSYIFCKSLISHSLAGDMLSRPGKLRPTYLDTAAAVVASATNRAKMRSS